MLCQMCKKPHNYQSFIKDAPGILGQCIDSLYTGSGWTYLVVMGGLHPLSNGDIAVARFNLDVPYVVLVLLLTYLQLHYWARRC